MANWNRHKHHNPCPVCGEPKRGCRTNEQTNVTHCRGDNPSPAYRFLKEDKHGFGMYKLEAEIEAFTQEQKEKWLEEKRAERERKQRQWEEQIKHQLSEKERDRAIREILNQLSLSEEHKEKLHQRGLSDEQIKNAGYRSVAQWQKLKQPVTSALAGVNRYGNGLVTPDSGILIPIPNEEGLWVGYQVRRDNPEDGNKYLWSASEQKRDPRPTVHTKDGELPLGVWGKPSDDGVVGLCESTGIKPYIASLRLGIPFIGAAGANFTSSPTALTSALTALTAKKIIIYPDAGAIINRHIHQQLVSTVNFLLERGYDVSFAWWGQEDKEDGDIDEINQETISAIEYLAPSEYIRKGWRDQSKARSEDEKQQWRDRAEKAAKRNWEKWRGFTPSHTVNQRYLDLECLPSELPEGKIYAIRSPLGTGKTELLRKIREKLEDEGFLAIGHRNGLLIQTANRIDGWHLKSVECGEYETGETKERINKGMARAEALKNNEQSVLLFCMDSLYKFHPDQFNNRNVILDEATTVLLHLLTSNTDVKKHLGDILPLFAECLRRAKRIICTDGMLSDSAIALLENLSGKESYKIQNDHKNSMTFNFLIGTAPTTEDGKDRPNDNSPMIHAVTLADLPVVTSDSQIFLAGMEKLLADSGKKNVLRIDGTTSGEPWAREFLKDPNNYIKKHKPDALLLSPSAQDGIDISIRGYFTDLFCFFFGVVSITSAHQMAFRIRDENIDRYLWAKVFSESTLDTARSCFPTTTKRYHEDFLLHDIKSAIAQGDTNTATKLLRKLTPNTEIDYYHNYLSGIRASDTYEKANYRECLIDSLERAGHSVNPFNPDQNDDFIKAKKSEKQAKSKAKEEMAIAIFNAPNLDADETVDDLIGGNWENQCKAKKHLLKERTNLDEDSPHWTPDLVKRCYFDDRQTISKIRRRIMFKDSAIALKLQRKKWHDLILGHIHKFHIKSDYLRVTALKDAGLGEIIEHLQSGAMINQDDGMLKRFINNCKTYDFRIAVGKSPTDKTQPIKWLTWCLDQLGYELAAKRNQSEARCYYLKSLPDWSVGIESAIADRLSEKSDRNLEELIENTLSSEQENPENSQNPHHYGKKSSSSNNGKLYSIGAAGAYKNCFDLESAQRLGEAVSDQDFSLYDRFSMIYEAVGRYGVHIISLLRSRITDPEILEAI